MSAELSPIVSEFETEEQAASYDHWFRAKVQASLDDHWAVYRVTDRIEIVAVLHARQEYP
ncbi:type II toxin-antitoxin system RelB family antitoxin [Pseudomonas sp. Ma2-10]